MWQTKQDNYANDLVKTQVCASFHMRADTQRKVLPKLIELSVGTSLLPGGGGGVNQQRSIREGN